MVDKSLTHIDGDGRVNMVDISAKPDTIRLAIASGQIRMRSETLDIVKAGGTAKGDIKAIAELAGIMGAKQTSHLIPLCHPLPLSGTKVRVEIDPDLPGLYVIAETKTTGKTGVEMEALCAVSVACLTIYDMLKAIDKGMEIGSIRLTHKSGGKSGEWNI